MKKILLGILLAIGFASNITAADTFTKSFNNRWLYCIGVEGSCYSHYVCVPANANKCHATITIGDDNIIRVKLHEMPVVDDGIVVVNPTTSTDPEEIFDAIEIALDSPEGLQGE